MPLNNVTYTILKNLYNFAPDLKQLMSVVDPQQGIELGINYPQPKSLTRKTLQRNSYRLPDLSFAAFDQSCRDAIILKYGHHLRMLDSCTSNTISQPKDMKAPGDRPPAYFDPSVMSDGSYR